jgi:hypothetical protein
VGASEFEARFGEPLSRALDLSTWLPGERLGDLYAKLEQEVRAAAKQAHRAREFIREEVLPRFAEDASEAPGGGLRQATVEQIERVHRGLLFTGQVEACDGTSVVHDTLALTIAQIGVCLVSYQGDAGSWAHRLYHRDLRIAPPDTKEEVMALLERRRRRGGGEVSDEANRQDVLSDLGRRGIMAYAERAVLADESTAPWRMGHGSAIPYELLTGSGSRELLEAGLDVLERLVLKHRRFVYVPSAPDRLLRTIGDALDPLEYAIVGTLRRTAEQIVEHGHYRGAWRDAFERARRFAIEAGSQVVVGLFRASAHAPAHVFYAHRDHADEAALIVLADAVLQEHRGFPTLIDLADRVCSATFDANGFQASVQLAYTETGLPYRYLRERETRYG